MIWMASLPGFPLLHRISIFLSLSICECPVHGFGHTASSGGYFLSNTVRSMGLSNNRHLALWKESAKQYALTNIGS